MPIRTLSRSRHSLLRETPQEFLDGSGSGYFYFGSNSRLKEYDLTNVRVVSNIVDTVRQLYSGVPDPELLARLKMVYETGYQPEIELFGYTWILSSGMAGAYRYMLRNNQLGLVVLIARKHVKPLSAETPFQFPVSTHLKIECSPHFLLSQSVAEAQLFLNGLANKIFTASRWDCAGVAIHLAADVAGIGHEIPENLSSRFVSRAHIRSTHNGITSLDYATHAVEYGQKESILYGRPEHIQANFYLKTKQAVATDKLDFWQNIWLQKKDLSGQSVCSITEPVMRFEFRLHHSAVKTFVPSAGFLGDAFLIDSSSGEFIFAGDAAQYQLGNTTYSQLNVDLANVSDFQPILSYLDASKHLDSIWRYCLACFSLRLAPNSVYIDPLWTVLHDDVSWDTQYTTFKRDYGKRSEGVEKNIGLFIGNALTLLSRKLDELTGISKMSRWFVKHLETSLFWMDIFDYYLKRLDYHEYLFYRQNLFRLGVPKDSKDLLRFVNKSVFDRVIEYLQDEVAAKGFTKRFLIGKAAI